MKPDKQRIAIAEYCGWKDVRTHLGIPPEGGRLFPYPEYHEEDWRLKPFRGIPDYLNDLNAMHEAEKMLSNPQWQEYGYQLEHSMLGMPASLTLHDLATVAHATAAQRAEAFLRTIGKWEE